MNNTMNIDRNGIALCDRHLRRAKQDCGAMFGRDWEQVECPADITCEVCSGQKSFVAAYRPVALAMEGS
jgi:hypothetical protein